MDAIIYFIITIAILVFVHEFGHFAAAKLSKMRVDAFAIGFGYRLFGYNKLTGFTWGNLPKDFDGEGNTDYRLCVLPLGGYVKIAGMVDESLDTKFADTPPKPYEFRAATTPKKVFVITAGVLMNLLLAVLIFWGANFFYGKQQSKTTSVGYITPGSPADSAGFMMDQKILAINNQPVKYWEDVRTAIYVTNLGKNLNFKIARAGETTSLYVPRKLVPKDEMNGFFLAPAGLKPLITDVLQGSRADSAGLKPNDVLLVLDDIELSSIPQTIEIISASVEDPVKVTLMRNLDTLTVYATPNKEGKIGVALGGYSYLGETERITYNVFQAFTLGVSDIWKTTALTFVMLKNVITGNIEFGQAFGGPIKIAQFAARSADSGFMNFLMFLAMLSLSLAIINILPFPVLDGGHLVIILIEGVLKRELPVKTKMIIQNAGFFVLMALMAFIIYNDIINL